MPINPELSDDSQDQGQDSTQRNQISSGESVGVTPGTSTSSQAGGASKQGTPTSSGSFTNLNQYVNANKDQAQGLGSKIEQNVQGSANKAVTQLNQAGNEFNQAEQAAGVNADDYSQDKVYETAQKALNNPSQLAQTDIDKFNDARTKSAAFAAGTDAGPKALTDLDSYQTAKSNLTDAQQNAQLTNSESGRNTLLRQVYQRPDYTQGQTNLDQLLTQNAPSNREKFKTLQDNLLGQYGLASQDNAAIQKAADQRQKVSTDTQIAGTNINNVLLGAADANNPQQGVLTQYQNTLQAKPGELNAQQQQSYNDKLTAVQAALQKQYGDSAFGIPVADLAKQVVTSQSTLGGATLSNSLNDQDLARLNALNSLAGRDQNTLGDNVLGGVDSNQFTPGITQNYATGNQAIQQKANAFKADASSLANQDAQATQGAFDNLTNLYRGNGQGDQLEQVQTYGQQADRLVSTLSGEIGQLNAQRQANGLPPLQVSQQDLATAQQQAYNKIAYGAVGNGQPYDPNVNYLGKTTYTGQPASQYINDRISSSNSNGYGNAYKQMIMAMTNANLYNNVIQNVKQNPGYQTPSDTIVAAPSEQ